MNREEILESVDKNGYFSYYDAPIIYDLLMRLPDKGSLLEIGTGRGDSAEFFAKVKPEWIIYTVDSYQVASEYVGAYGLNDFGWMMMVWRNKYPRIIPIIHDCFTLPWEIPVDVLYIDGDHNFEAVKRDFNNFSPFVKDDGYVLFDDYTAVGNDFGVKEVVDSLDKTKWQVHTYNRMASAKRI